MKVGKRKNSNEKKATEETCEKWIPEPNTISDYGGDRIMLLTVKTMPPIELARRKGESAMKTAARYLEIANGCYGD